MRKRWLMVTGQIKENGNQGRTEGVEGVLPPPEQLRGVYNFEFLDLLNNWTIMENDNQGHTERVEGIIPPPEPASGVSRLFCVNIPRY